ncbi:MAG: Glu-tRNA(Gln) amidotransferase subunit GatE [Candidatus Krumholzibacteriales bacterium]
MADIKKFEDATAADYAALGLKSGLEIHQQLLTGKKLFCRCPVREYTDEYDAEILRHMRPTLSELGEYDGTALMEFKTRKDIIYQIDGQTVCTYEMDDTPPFELNRQALDIALEITMLLNCKLVSEVHIARKQYLDGSIPTGFQRTTILGMDGSIHACGRDIGIIQLGLEEDACREVSDRGHTRTYRTDRLGIPLVESVTRPDMKTPQEVAEVAQRLRYLVRATGKVRTGIGAARQDVNVSIEGGRRVEIKGVPRIPLIPLLVHNEAYRQHSLLKIAGELKQRGITEESFRCSRYSIRDILRNTQYSPAAKSLKKGEDIRAVVLKGYRDILSRETQPETTFAREISDRVRVIACLDKLPNIAHSDIIGETFSSSEWQRIKNKTGCGENDVAVVVWGNQEDAETAVNEIEIRAREAITGVVNETRQALPDGTNGFERILPGPDRMYPDTDLPPLAITEDRIERIRKILPKTPAEREAEYIKSGLRPGLAWRMSISDMRDTFDFVLGEAGYEPEELAFFILNRVAPANGSGAIPEFSKEKFKSVLALMGERGIPLESLAGIMEDIFSSNEADPESLISGIVLLRSKEKEKEAIDYLESLDIPDIERDKLKDYLTGVLIRKYGGSLPGKRGAEIVESFLSDRRNQ